MFEVCEMILLFGFLRREKRRKKREERREKRKERREKKEERRERISNLIKEKENTFLFPYFLSSPLFSVFCFLFFSLSLSLFFSLFSLFSFLFSLLLSLLLSSLSFTLFHFLLLSFYLVNLIDRQLCFDKRSREHNQAKLDNMLWFEKMLSFLGKRRKKRRKEEKKKRRKEKKKKKK